MTLLDVGASAEARREHLVQFAFMGAALARTVLGLQRPRVGLLSNGEEAARGSALVVETHAELARRADADALEFEFVGNVEGGDLVSGRADVIVTDGFTGNVALKLMEGVSQTMLGAVREAAMSSTRAKAGGLLLRGALGGFREQIDPEAQRRRLPARTAPPRRGSARALQPARLRAGDPARAARRERRPRRRDPAGARAGGRAEALTRVRAGR